MIWFVVSNSGQYLAENSDKLFPYLQESASNLLKLYIYYTYIYIEIIGSLFKT